MPQFSSVESARSPPLSFPPYPIHSIYERDPSSISLPQVPLPFAPHTGEQKSVDALNASDPPIVESSNGGKHFVDNRRAAWSGCPGGHKCRIDISPLSGRVPVITNSYDKANSGDATTPGPNFVGVPNTSLPSGKNRWQCVDLNPPKRTIYLASPKTVFCERSLTDDPPATSPETSTSSSITSSPIFSALKLLATIPKIPLTPEQEARLWRERRRLTHTPVKHSMLAYELLRCGSSMQLVKAERSYQMVMPLSMLETEAGMDILSKNSKRANKGSFSKKPLDRNRSRLSCHLYLCCNHSCFKNLLDKAIEAGYAINLARQVCQRICNHPGCSVCDLPRDCDRQGQLQKKGALTDIHKFIYSRRLQQTLEDQQARGLDEDQYRKERESTFLAALAGTKLHHTTASLNLTAPNQPEKLDNFRTWFLPLVSQETRFPVQANEALKDVIFYYLRTHSSDFLGIPLHEILLSAVYLNPALKEEEKL
ncbi:hypothetical protein ABKN59_007684 [Abortiporus biennis]